jgi:hypothetical protein
MKIHSCDIQPGADRLSHYLIVNGEPAGRYNTLSKALEARALFLKPLLSGVAAIAAAELPINENARLTCQGIRRAPQSYETKT